MTESTDRGPDTPARMPTTTVPVGGVPERILVVGDPARAARVAERLDGSTEISRNREYALFGGRHRGESIGVMSHGVGAAGAALCFEELARAGVRRMVRAGTCGGLQPDVVDGDLVVATAAVRDDGLSTRLVPAEFPAVASTEIIRSLRDGATARSVRFAEGIVLTSDVFYPHDVLGSNLEMWARARTVAVEMECAALFIIATLYGIETGAILAVDGNPLAAGDEDMSGYDPHRSIVADAVDAMVDIALDTVGQPL